MGYILNVRKHIYDIFELQEQVINGELIVEELSKLSCGCVSDRIEFVYLILNMD